MSEVFISYAWGGESEEIANVLEQTLQEKGIKLIRDKTNLGYKGLIQEFMQQIGQGNCVIAIISDKYLKSKNCMYELLEISRNGDFYDRIFPIVLSDARIYDVIERLNYIKYWEDKIKELEAGMRGVGLANLQGITEEINLYTEIRNKIAGLVDTLQNMNTLAVEMHKEADFREVVEAIAKRLNKNPELPPQDPRPLSGLEKRELREALIDAFRNYDRLKMLLSDYLDVDINTIVSQGNYASQVSEVIEWSESNGKTKELLESAHQENQGNLKLKAFYQKYSK